MNEQERRYYHGLVPGNLDDLQRCGPQGSLVREIFERVVDPESAVVLSDSIRGRVAGDEVSSKFGVAVHMPDRSDFLELYFSDDADFTTGVKGIDLQKFCKIVFDDKDDGSLDVSVWRRGLDAELNPAFSVWLDVRLGEIKRSVDEKGGAYRDSGPVS